MVTISDERAAAVPVRRAADLPHDLSCFNWRNHGLVSIRPASVASDASVEPSSTKIISNDQRPARTRSTSFTRAAMLPASFFAGTTIETIGAADCASIITNLPVERHAT